MGESIIEVNNVIKSFKIPLDGSNGIKQKLINVLRGRRGYRIFKPLNGISFTIERGDFFGIVGKNGSGKSTLLKLLSGIYIPNKGHIIVNGSLTPFIELGVGFNPELTGRENVYLNGALLGFSRKEIANIYSDIVEFAEMGNFMEEKLKNFSSGMQVRLAFSIAIQSKSDILVLDEVLAVGDEAFQRKCFSYFDQLKREKKTVVLVTHDMAAVERFCNKALFLEDGKVKLEGKPHKVAAAYSRSNEARYSKTLKEKEQSDDGFVIETYDINGKKKTNFDYLDDMVVKLKWKQQGVHNFGVAIFRNNGEYVFGPNTFQDGYKVKQGANEAEYSVKLNLNDGEYFIKAGLMGDHENDTIAFIEEGPHFIVGRDYKAGRWGGVTSLDHKWNS